MQSLRERLIQQGNIRPKCADDSAFEGNQRYLRNTQDKVLKILQDIHRLQENFKKINEINDVFRKEFKGLSLNDFFQKSNCSYSDLLRYVNLHRVLENLINKKEKFSDVFSVIRTGFFFAFKENMRNTP